MVVHGWGIDCRFGVVGKRGRQGRMYEPLAVRGRFAGVQLLDNETSPIGRGQRHSGIPTAK